ncbi:WD40-repeat-containing domain protein, partial [Phycomyces nitens]
FNPDAKKRLDVDLVHSFDHDGVVCSVKFSPDGYFLATGGNRLTKIYDTTYGALIAVLEDENSDEAESYIRALSFSPDGRYIATGSEDQKIRIWDIAKKCITRELVGHEQDIYSLDFSGDGRVLVSGSGDKTARVWDWVKGECVWKLKVDSEDVLNTNVTSVSISPDGRLVATGSLDGMVRIWDIEKGELIEELLGHENSVYSVSFMPDNGSLVSGSIDKTGCLWRIGASRPPGDMQACKQRFVGHKDSILSVATTPCGEWVVSGSKDRNVQFWDPHTGENQFLLQGHTQSVISVAVSQGKRSLFATASIDNRARVWSYVK